MLRRVGYAFGLLGSVLLVGTVGYALIERWSLLDALYMTVITVGTVGFREVHELSIAGRVFTMVLIIAGFGAVIFSIGTIIDFMVEGHFTGFLEGRRMRKRIDGMRGHHVVAGLGRVGSVVADQFAERSVPFVVIDGSTEALAIAREKDWAYVEGDATEALDTDAANLFVTLTARGMQPGLFIVARATTPSTEAKLLRAGADRVITPTDIGGRRMAAMALESVTESP
jgi:voltage-gated potassium channel